MMTWDSDSLINNHHIIDWDVWASCIDDTQNVHNTLQSYDIFYLECYLQNGLFSRYFLSRAVA